jgi:hypothetical protein
MESAVACGAGRHRPKILWLCGDIAGIEELLGKYLNLAGKP